MKLIQVRNVPDDVHRKLKERAAREGTTMSDIALRELERVANEPSLDEMVERIMALPAPERPLRDSDIVEIIRERRGPLPNE
jgi:plasmid stability protein